MTDLLSPDDVCALIPGMTKANLAQLRYRGIGPTFYKPSPRVIVYRREDIERWLERSRFSGNATPAIGRRRA